MLHASTRKLIDRLSEMTELGKLDWTEDEDGTLAYATEGYSVTLSESPNEVIITSKTGKELERATAEELASTLQDDGGAYTSIVAAMTMEASRIARGTEAAISSLLADLQDEPEVDPADLAAAEIEADEDLVEDPINETTAIVTEPVTRAVPEAKPEMAAETAEQAEPSAADDASSQDDPQTDEPEPETIAAPEMDPVEADFATTESEPAFMSEPEAVAETDATPDETTAPETETKTETESEVTEAVARLANEVNQRQDTGLDAAAASAVGAVALAAGLTTRSEPEESDVPAEDVDETPIEIAATEPEAVPAYIPFGLETEAEEEVAIVAATDMTSEDVSESEAHDAPTEIAAAAPFAFTPAAEPAPQPAETMWKSSDAEADPEPEGVAEPAAEVAADKEPETPFQIAAEPAGDPVSDFHVSAPAFSGIMGASANEPEDLSVAEDAPEEVAAAAEVEETAEAEAVEAPAPTPEPEPEAAPPEPPKTYSLSGIGAGFGLGALSAKTEASGIPSARPANTPAPEKVIIDATDDVLPELEGNLNVSLAETASAAVSAANAEPPVPEQVETPQEDETDILKPRTRFNPWD